MSICCSARTLVGRHSRHSIGKSVADFYNRLLGLEDRGFRRCGRTEWAVWKWSGKTHVSPDRWWPASAARCRGQQGGARAPRQRPDGLTWVLDGSVAAIDHPLTAADRRQPVGQERCQRRLQIIWAGADVCRLFAVNVGSFANNPGPGPPLFAVNPGRKSRCLQVGPRMFVGRYR